MEWAALRAPEAIMKNVLAAAATFLLLALPAHAQLQPVQPQQPLGGWDSRSGPQPRMGDTQDCHAEAQRQAQARYPPQRIGNPRQEIIVQNPNQFPAETSFFQECMRRKGF
jgi:hypothetical protein